MDLLTNFRLSNHEKNLDIYGIHLYQEGRPPVEHRFRSNDRVNLYSASKTFVAIGIGIAENEGLLTLRDSVLDFFPEYRSIATLGSELMTIENLLNMASGHLSTDYSLYNTMDRAELFFRTQVQSNPGTTFFYEDLASYMLGRIIEKQSGHTLLEYLKPRLFAPLGIENPQWHTCQLGHTACSGGLYLTTEEFSRMGILLLQKGTYKDHKLIPESFIRRMQTAWIDTSSKNDPETVGGYGYQVWKCTPENTYRADGMYGQLCVISNNHKAVITVTAHNELEHKEILRAIWQDILPYLE